MVGKILWPLVQLRMLKESVPWRFEDWLLTRRCSISRLALLRCSVIYKFQFKIFHFKQTNTRNNIVSNREDGVGPRYSRHGICGPEIRGKPKRVAWESLIMT